MFGALAALAVPAGPVDWMPVEPGPATFLIGKEALVLSNRSIEARFSGIRGHYGLSEIYSHWAEVDPLKVTEPFEIRFRDGRSRPASAMKVIIQMHRVHRSDGESVEATVRDVKDGLTIQWRVLLPNGANYLRQEVSVKADRTADVAAIVLGAGPATARISGNVPGSPLLIGGDRFFAGLEHPMSASTNAHGWATRIDRKLPILPGQTISYSAVYGVAPEGQMRRSVLRYVERERPRKYSPFLHYNSWYDLGYFTKYDADQCVERIKTFGRELAIQRHVPLKSFLFDDGWDDTATVWSFHSGFPDEFKPLKRAAEAFGADPGIWLSPWGGYGPPRQERLKTGKANGYEIDAQGYALSGPKYYQRFHDVTMNLVKHDGINQFKFDGTGSPDKQFPGSRFSSDFEAAIALIHDLRAARPGLFINLTTGTWPSPFWTRYADSIWRGGEDHSFAGVGSKREQWITYRDGDTYHGVVQKGPLYPLNSLMLHGIIYAQHAHDLNADPGDDFRNEVRDYFGTGTQLQEMYITPSLLTKQNWDDLAAAALWSDRNRDVLVDTHWVGGDPNRLQVYGFASWSRQKAIVTLRNPSDHPQAFSLDPRRVFELPRGTKGSFVGRDPYLPAGRGQSVEIWVDQPKVLLLQPFQVCVLEGAVR